MTEDFDTPPFPSWNWHEEWYPLGRLDKEPIVYKDEDELLVRNFINPKLAATFKISEPKGFLDVSKQVRLVVGEGDDKIEVGKAQVDQLPNGDAAISLVITNSALIKALGATEIKGIIPNMIDPPDMTEDTETN